MRMGRIRCCEMEGLRRGRWTAEEDNKLRSYIQANGEGSWRLLPKNAGLLRCGKSCRLRWINYLRTDLKRGNITPHEDETILKLHTTFGNRWSLIAGHLPGRTDNEIKNYWNSHLSKKIRSSSKKNAAEASAKPKRRSRGRPNKSALLKKNEKLTMEGPESPAPLTEENEEKEPMRREETGSCCLDCRGKEPEESDDKKKIESSSSTAPVLKTEDWGSSGDWLKEDIIDESGEWYSASSMDSNFDSEWLLKSNFDSEWLLKWEWDEGHHFGQNLWSGFKDPSWFLANSNDEREEECHSIL